MLHRYTILIIILFASAFSVNAQSWKAYPYHQSGSVLNFPRDEGYHPGEVVEWWYTNAHLTGDSSGNDYTMMLSYFYYPTLGFDGFRIFNIANETNGAFYPETQPCHYTVLSQDHLEINSNTGLFGANHEDWETLKDTGNHLIPFQYHIKATSANGAADLTYNAVKRPLMVGGTGYLYEGTTGYTYYYSETKLEVSGTFTVHGVTEHVSGIAWIDRQWGQFNPNNGEKYAWYSLQLSNGMDMNLWNIFNPQNQIPDTSTYRFCSIYVNDSTSSTIDSFGLQRLKYTYTHDGVKCYDQKWRLTFDSVDLTITAKDSSNEILLPFRFFEGSADITGTVGGVPVTGVGYAELLHSFARPQLKITSPAGHHYWSGSIPISWHPLNPDDGCPLYYDVEVSTNNKVSYTKIAAGLTDTTFNWTPNLSNGTEGWFKVSGYSIDSTLSGFAVSDSSFIIGISGISEAGDENLSITNYPNPFDEQTIFTYKLKQAGKLKLDILNIQGTVVKDIYNGFTTPGEYSLVWDGKNESGSYVSPGVYIYRFQLNESFNYGKMLKVK